MSDIAMVTVPVGALHRNPWNPNRMSQRVYEAEKESIQQYGFIDPVTVRPHPDHTGEFEIIDGEHRWRAAQEIGYEELPVIAIDNLSDAQAKKLTIILNETRGEADVALLGKLVADIRQDVDLADLKIGLPYTDDEIESLTTLGSFDLGDNPPSASPPPPVDTHVVVLQFGSRKDVDRFHTLAQIIDHEHQTGGESAAVLAALTSEVQRLEQG